MLDCRSGAARKDLRSNLRSSLSDGFLANVMVGAGETFLPAFALAIGASDVTAGLIATIPLLVGSAFQLLVPRVLERVGSYKRWVVAICIVQALSFVPLIAFVMSGHTTVPTAFLFLVAIVYWSCGLGAQAAWNTWIVALVPKNLRTRFFARRNHFGQLGLLCGLIAAGLLLDRSKSNGTVLLSFAGVFAVSTLARLGSAYSLARQTEHPQLCKNQIRLSIPEAAQRLFRGREGCAIASMLVLTLAVNIASPFFNPYMLKHLKMSYASYMFMIAASYVAKIITFSLLSRSTKGVDPIRMVRIGLVGVAISPVLWIFSSSYPYLLMGQVFSGIVWALYELGALLLLLHLVRDSERTSVISVYNFASAVMVLLGSSIGAKLIAILGETSSTYFVVFALSGLARFGATMYFTRVTRMSKSETASGSGKSGGTPVVAPARPRELESA